MRFGTVSLLLRLTKKHYFTLRISRFIRVLTMGDKADKKPFERLPNNVVPKNYALTLTPNLKDFTFLGEEIVELEVKTCTDKITMNCAEINISSVSIKNGGKDIKSKEITYDKEKETVCILFPSNLSVGSGVLCMKYLGELNDKMKGFYRSKYKTPGGEEKYCAVTQFEAADARRAFPCWDEPAIKATFDITMIVPKDKVTLSNMDVIEETAHEEDLKIVKFAKTPIMSTYLLAFVVGEFDYVEDRDEDGILVRVYTPLEKSEQGKFALEVAVKTLPFYKNYFKISYPLPKIDLIAIPDFAAGAMENWGLVTYRETALLVDPTNSSSSSKQWVALVVGHELAHQWFGNLVTMEWWTHLWLNEGFASWIEYLCVDYCHPKYDIWTQFVTSDYTRALDLDAMNNSHPIEVPVGGPDEVDEIFDLISYSKGASVIRMLHDYIGDKDYKNGLHQYLTKFSYKNAMTEDLWESLSEASGKDVEKVMTSWTKQMGYPVLFVSDDIQNGTKHILTIMQKKFSANGPSEEDTKYIWNVPLTVSSSDNPKDIASKALLETRSSTIEIKSSAAVKWIKVNPGQIGFYRVHYTDEMLETLVPAIKDLSLPPLDRLGVQNDQFALARAGYSSTVNFLTVVDAFTNEPNYTVWNDVSTNLGKLATLLQYTEFNDSFKSFLRQLYKPVADILGWEPKADEGHLNALLRSLVIRFLGKCGDMDIVREANKRFDAHVKGESSIPADLRSPVYSIVLAHGDHNTLNTIKNLYRKSELQEEKIRLMTSMGSVKEHTLIQDVLNFSLSEEVRAQDTVFCIGGTVGSVQGREKAWKFTKDNWKEFHDRYKGAFLLSRLVKVTTENFATNEMAEDVEQFFREHDAPAAERAIQQSLEGIRLNAQWLKRDKDAINEWLTSKGF
ncbi:puromycin-sensitive aminopeptidase-like [Dendronephthya gigantea]|uniref:puromycin-sensitive aminopeptidase-like n=1 Tax=Dendronephthya gigantea TaxID=151771 RepID=UPI00106C9C83|nr:puromycin-sensitive aminopeptidase-like [Dendronephthya gigantea]